MFTVYVTYWGDKLTVVTVYDCYIFHAININVTASLDCTANYSVANYKFG